MNDEQAVMQAAADRLSAKLQAFYTAPPDDEKLVMASMLGHMAAQAEVSGRRMTARIVVDVSDDADADR